jgi:CO/xanthine dehydrogenase Mo-binding subunit
VVSVQTDGSVIVSSGITDMGQGAQTQMSQIAAEVLGISMDRVRFLNTNTSRVPDSGPTVASRGTIMGGSAAKKAAENVRATLLEVACDWLKMAPGKCEFAGNHLVAKPGGKRLASFNEIAAECFRRGKPMYGFGWHERDVPPTSDELLEANRDWYLYAIEQFGPQRCMFESNFPVDKLSCTYIVLWNQFKKLTKDFSPSDRAAMFHDTARRVYRLPLV